MMPMPSFEEVFAAAYPGRAAFPWQGRLVREILVGGWPSVLDLPTGVGKTTALDIALYCLAAAPEVMPRRTVLVVDRRIVVDQGAIHARELLDKITVASGGPLAALAVRLRDLWGASSGPPFRVAVMRGGVPRDNDWARRPDQPLLGVSTVDQLGSRLLFRGYGIGPRSASIHAGLVGNDTLILLDEVHLANAFAELLDKIHHRFRGVTTELPRRFIVTQMSATVRSARSSRVFQLDDADRADPTIHRRLVASKRAALRVVKVAGDDEPNKLEAVAARAVQDAIAQQAAGARVVAIVVNRVDTARIASRLLDRHRATTDALLITGRMRPIERDYLVEHALVPRAGARRIRTPECRPLIVVATQCIEAGADLDFDAMVTECASLDALRQRFGRVDRRGDLGASESVILCRSDQIAEGFEDPVYGEALGNTWRWLVARAASGAIDLGISALPAAGDDALLPPLGEVPVLLPAHLDAWAQTSQIPAADPDISLWLHGKAKPGADVQVVWRAGADVHGLDEPGVERLIQRLQACRPSALEAVTVPLAVVRRWLEDQPMVNAVADVEGEVMDEPRGGRSDTLRGRRVLRWRADESEVIWPGALRRGDIIVVDAAPGEMRRALLDPGSTEPVIDLGDLAQLRGRGLATLRLQREALAVWQLPAIMLDAIPAPSDDQDLEELERQIGAWLALWPEPVPAGFLGTQAEWEAARRALQSRSRRIIVAGGTLIVTARTGLPAETEDAVTEDDDSSFRTAEVTLAEHSASVRDLARQYARALGLGDELADDLALAAWFHDVGKADPRFQRWLVGGSEATRDPPLAKSALAPGSVRERRIARERAGYPKGYRHELLSLAMVQHHQTALEAAHDRDLVLHLVASHHGWCRPFPPPVADTEDLPVHLQHGADQLTSTTDHALARLDSGVAARFWRLVAQYGWWGLAWLEAIVRLADHRASQQAATGGAP
jgi:CRISPR-associated endonuclease/helicase Cas3